MGAVGRLLGDAPCHGGVCRGGRGTTAGDGTSTFISHDENYLATADQGEKQVESAVLHDTVVGERAAAFRRLAREVKPLHVQGDALLVFNH